MIRYKMPDVGNPLQQPEIGSPKTEPEILSPPSTDVPNPEDNPQPEREQPQRS